MSSPVSKWRRDSASAADDEPPPTPPHGPFDRSPSPRRDSTPPPPRWDPPSRRRKDGAGLSDNGGGGPGPVAVKVGDGGDVERPSPPSSPDSSCPICLCRLDDKSKTDSCMHLFCFSCLVEWAKVKLECPLCKLPFKSIFHKIKSDSEFEEFLVPRPNPVARYVSSFGVDQMMRSYMNLIERSFPMRNRLLLNAFFDRGRMMRPQLRRHEIYERDLWACELRNAEGRVRQCDPNFYRANEAQTHRLRAWVNRELVVLHRLIDSIQLQSTQERIASLLFRFNIVSQQFSDFLRPILGSHTLHFLHEFYVFARCPYDMAGFDTHVQYESRTSAVLWSPVFALPSSSVNPSDTSDSDVEVVDEPSTGARSRRRVDDSASSSSRSPPSSSASVGSGRTSRASSPTTTPRSAGYAAADALIRLIEQRIAASRTSRPPEPVSSARPRPVFRDETEDDVPDFDAPGRLRSVVGQVIRAPEPSVQVVDSDSDIEIIEVLGRAEPVLVRLDEDEDEGDGDAVVGKPRRGEIKMEEDEVEHVPLDINQPGPSRPRPRDRIVSRYSGQVAVPDGKRRGRKRLSDDGSSSVTVIDVETSADSSSSSRKRSRTYGAANLERSVATGFPAVGADADSGVVHALNYAMKQRAAAAVDSAGARRRRPCRRKRGPVTPSGAFWYYDDDDGDSSVNEDGDDDVDSDGKESTKGRRRRRVVPTPPPPPSWSSDSDGGGDVEERKRKKREGKMPLKRPTIEVYDSVVEGDSDSDSD